jgi:E3 ubiquitin-protein ligase HUWE1
MNKEAHTVKLTISRKNLLIESLQKLLDVPLNELNAGPIRISFEGEEGLDAGGLAKDWFGAVGRALVDRSECLLIPSGTHTSYYSTIP